MFALFDSIPLSVIKFLVIITVAIFALLLAYIVGGGSTTLDDWPFSGDRWR